MLRTGSVEQRLSTRTFDHDHFHGWTEYLIDSDPQDKPAPQAFLVHQDPLWKLTPHFHKQEQFQLVVGGSGTLGAHALLPGSIHYATRETGYGPIVAGAGGLDYLTLRCITDPGAWYLPESREHQRKSVAKRQKWAQATVDAQAHEPLLTELLLQDDTGLAAWSMTLPPDSTMTAPPGAGSGRFHVVLAGTARLDTGDEDVVFRGCFFASADEGPVRVRSGAAGLQLIVLQFPSSAVEAME